MEKHKDSPKTILVTGCAGFIGSNFARKFKDQFPKTVVIGIDDLSSGRLSEVDKRVIFHKDSILNTPLLETIFKKHKPDYVFHFAANPRVSYCVLNPIETNDININGTVNLLKLSAKYKVKRFIFSSSSAIYGEIKHLPTSESEIPNPQSPYAIQKQTGEGFCKIYSNLFGLDTVSLRYFNVFGPGQYGDSAYTTVISAWLESLYFPKNKQAFIEGNGKQSRDFCYVDNVIEANICAMKSSKDLNGGIFNIGNSNRINLLEIHKLIESNTNKKLKLEKRSPRLGDVSHTQADISKAKKILGYKPIYNFEEGLIQTIKWFEGRTK